MEEGKGKRGGDRARGGRTNLGFCLALDTALLSAAEGGGVGMFAGGVAVRALVVVVTVAAVVAVVVANAVAVAVRCTRRGVLAGGRRRGIRGGRAFAPWRLELDRGASAGRRC